MLPHDGYGVLEYDAVEYGGAVEEHAASILTQIAEHNLNSVTSPVQIR
jgi:hypothetical protein